MVGILDSVGDKKIEIDVYEYGALVLSIPDLSLWTYMKRTRTGLEGWVMKFR